ncbi:hypothetical protein AB6806_20515 [Bosea sp. RCC_152_1]|uniref:hypothetical protein n=1 Tax=Bosea sp. RCC_152_1 TaxID=3239228 RepID=UPI003525A90F
MATNLEELSLILNVQTQKFDNQSLKRAVQPDLHPNRRSREPDGKTPALPTIHLLQRNGFRRSAFTGDTIWGRSVPEHPPPPPRQAAKGALLIVVTIAAIIVTIFIGFNIYHAKTLREEKAGQIDQRDAPKSPTDLQAPRNPQRP